MCYAMIYYVMMYYIIIVYCITKSWCMFIVSLLSVVVVVVIVIVLLSLPLIISLAYFTKSWCSARRPQLDARQPAVHAQELGLNHIC